MNGIDQTIVKRAEEFESLSRKGEDLVAACIRLAKEEAEDLKLAVSLTSAVYLLDDGHHV